MNTSKHSLHRKVKSGKCAVEKERGIVIINYKFYTSKTNHISYIYSIFWNYEIKLIAWWVKILAARSTDISVLEELTFCVFYFFIFRGIQLYLSSYGGILLPPTCKIGLFLFLFFVFCFASFVCGFTYVPLENFSFCKFYFFIFRGI